MSLTKQLTPLLRRAIKRYQVPGASMAILRNDRIMTTAAAGVCSLETQVPVTEEAVFQIGSITKPLTTTLVMQLVDEGLLDLDAPVQEYLPNFRVADLAVSREVTPRHLLSHQSGIDGDFFVDSGRGDGATEHLLEMGTMLPSLFPIGTKLSYCNFGFAVLGRIIEVATNRTWDAVMQERLFDPLGMERAFTLPEMALRFRCAIGHVQSSRRKGAWHASKIPYLSIGQKAAGATPSMTATDLLRFAQLHLNRGRNASGDRLLSTRSAREMQKRHIRVHGNAEPKHWGLGWILYNWDGHRVYGHNGGTIGQAAYLRILPERNIAVALLTNGGDASGLAQEILGYAFNELARVRPPETPPYDDDLKIDPQPLCGRYGNLNQTLEFTAYRGQLRVTSLPNGGGVGVQASTRLGFIDKNTARLRSGDTMLDRMQFHFSDFHDGQPQYVALGLRQYQRRSA